MKTIPAHTQNKKICTPHARIGPGLVLSTELKVGDRNDALARLILSSKNQQSSRDPKPQKAWLSIHDRASYATNRCCCPCGVCCQRDYTCVKQQDYVFHHALLEKRNHAFFLLSCDPAYVRSYHWICSASQSGRCTIGCCGDHRLQGFRGGAVDHRP